jgi:hypothetical protein
MPSQTHLEVCYANFLRHLNLIKLTIKINHHTTLVQAPGDPYVHILWSSRRWEGNPTSALRRSIWQWWWTMSYFWTYCLASRTPLLLGFFLAHGHLLLWFIGLSPQNFYSMDTHNLSNPAQALYSQTYSSSCAISPEYTTHLFNLVLNISTWTFDVYC